jgi:hypothetical protein
MKSMRNQGMSWTYKSQKVPNLRKEEGKQTKTKGKKQQIKTKSWEPNQHWKKCSKKKGKVGKLPQQKDSLNP